MSLSYDANSFIEQAYQVFLGRKADPAGMQAHITFLEKGGTPAELLSIFSNSDEYQRRSFVSSYVNRWIGFSESDIHFLESCRKPDLKPTAGFVTDFIGSKSRISALWRGCEHLDGIIHPLPIPGDFHADANEWIGTLKAVKAATGSFSVMELGAGMGPWVAAAGVAAMNRGITDIYICAVEGDAGRFALLQQHLADNGLDNVPQSIMQAAVGVEDGIAYWPRLDDPANQAGARPMRAGVEDDKVYLKHGFSLQSMVEVKVVSFSSLLAQRPFWDLIHIDVQGTEVELCLACAAELKKRARYMVIGTHSRKLDGDLLDLFHKEGWRLEHERPSVMTYDRNFKDLSVCTTQDGTQVWRNPRL
jgi:FkbM family methyltransferase